MWLLAALVVLGAALLRGVTGVGSGLIIVPALALLYGPVTAVAIAVVLELIATVWLLPQAWQATRWPVIGALVVGYAPGIALGVQALTMLAPAALKALVGCTSIGFALLVLSGLRLPAHGVALRARTSSSARARSSPSWPRCSFCTGC
jgi:uncharacterized membrane protein YfcA